MVIVETSFPRGGTVKSSGEQSSEVFGARHVKRKSVNLTKKEREQKRKEAIEKSQDANNIEAISAELLNHKTIQEEMIIMGCIKSIDGTFLKISLPGRIIGKALASSISDSYTKLLNKYVEGDESEEFKPLYALFQKGQTVYTKVMKIVTGDDEKLNIELSLKPSDLHSNMHHDKIRKGMFFNGAIAEVQDHGYVIETGIKNLRSFLPLEQSDSKFYVGQLVSLKIEKLTQNDAASTAVCKLIAGENRKVKDFIDPKIDYILPSAVVKFTVTKILKDGLQGTIMNGAFTGYINEHQLNEPLTKPDDFEINTTISARLLYTMPLTKLLYLSFNLNAFDAEDSAYQKGDIIEKAIVHHIGTGGIILNLGNGIKGLISFHSIKANYIGNYDQDEILTKYRNTSQHKVRVIEYDPLDSLYICADNPHLLNEKYYTISDIKSGDFVTGIVQEKDRSGGYILTIGKLRGLIENVYLQSTSTNIPEGTKLRCRVISTNTERKFVYLTNRPEYMVKTAKLLTSINEAKQNKNFIGTIVKCYEKYFLIKFFNNLKGIFYKNRITGFMQNEIESFGEGQTMVFRIIANSTDAEKILIGLADDVYKIGELCTAKVTNIIQNGIEIAIDDEYQLNGFVPVRLLSDFPELITAHLKCFNVDDTIDVACMIKNIFSLRDGQYFRENPIQEWAKIKSGDILRGYIKNVEEDIIEILLPVRKFDKLVKVHLRMFIEHCSNSNNITVVPEQVIYVKVLAKEKLTRTFTVSAKLPDVWNGNLDSTAELYEKYLNEIKMIRKSLKKNNYPIGNYELAGKVKAKIIAFGDENNDVFLELPNGVRGIINGVSNMKGKKLKIGDELNCAILWIDYVNEIVFLTHKSDDIERITKGMELPENLKKKIGINAKILLKTTDVIVCTLKKGKNPLIYIPTKLHYNDFGNISVINTTPGEFCRLAFIHDKLPIAVLESTWKLWKQIKAQKRKLETDTASEEHVVKKRIKLIKSDKIMEKRFPIRPEYTPMLLGSDDEEETTKSPEERLSSLFFTDTEGKSKQNKLDKKKKITEKELPKKNVKILSKTDEKSESESEVEITKKLKPRTKKNDNKKNPKSESESESESEVQMNKKGLKSETKPVLPGASDFWSTDLKSLAATKKPLESSDEDDDADDNETEKNLTKTKKKLTASERFKAERQEEERLRKIEESYANPNEQPQTADQFDRLVISNPNNSISWINYMVYHLQATEIDKARNVARRALKSISFREEQELINIWIALLNLELRYGNKESFKEILNEAVLCNDPYKIYTRCIQILSDTNKIQELSDMIVLVTKKFKEKPDIWKCAANAYFDVGLPEKGKQLLHKALNAIPEREHINMIVSFANLNYKHEDKETAHALLEEVISSYPKRIDVWSQYVDMLVKDKDIESARRTLERSVTQKIPIKKMRSLFKKYMDFEEKYGNEESVQNVKEMVTKYLKNEINP